MFPINSFLDQYSENWFILVNKTLKANPYEHFMFTITNIFPQSPHVLIWKVISYPFFQTANELKW